MNSPAHPLKIIIVGSGGRLGAALLREWRAAGDQVLGFNRQLLDLGDFDAIRERLEGQEFDALVNCAALTNVDYCETHPEEAHRLNAQAVATIADVCSRKRARCVHISTDYVFDGAKTGPYTEEDEALPISSYGASKLAGERLLHAVSLQHLAVRVSWVFGPDRPSFVDQILKRALEVDTVQAIADKEAVPTYTLDAARLLRPLLDSVRIGGVLHLCNAGSCSWQEYGQYALDCAVAAGMPLRARTVGAQRMADLTAFIAKRPPNTVMSTAKLTALTGLKPRSWQEAVEEYVRTQWVPANRPHSD
ncbi:MAG: dTDP-4-dehydrorhamnose reductase [Chthoniobacter sp.]|jgi:dTDP-4-dehydrorhamnose reductase|nr:dTDP-4-dehydrorhamnose reductase [Chthoniobacter sp.]